MLKIGEFSRISQVPVKTLRYYEELGLINPTHVDAFTGYRHYSVEQLPRLNRILALKDLGFSLEEIGRVVNEGVSLENLRGMLRLRQAEQSAQVLEAQDRLARVEARLALIEREGQENGYRVAGPGRDVYHQSTTGGNQNDPNCVTEILFPVERV